MSFVLSLIAACGKDRLDGELLDRATACLARGGARFEAPVWLAEAEACDIPFHGAAEVTLASVREALRGRAVDVNVVAAAFRRKRLLLADMDSTLIEQECIDELAVEAGSVEAGSVEAVAAITERAMRGEIGFEPALRARVALLRGLPISTVDHVLRTRITLMPGATVLAATMRSTGAYAALVSGGFTSFTGPIADRLGFNEHRANTLLTADGELTGEVGEPVFGRSGKAEALAELTAKLALDRAETLAVGDGANDLAMIKEAGLGVAFRAKPALRDVADAVIDHADLTGILFLQGFRRDEFAWQNRSV